MQRKIIMILHPISGDVYVNLKKIGLIKRKLNLNEKEIHAITPYVADAMFMQENEPEELEIGIQNNLDILKTGIVKEVWLYGSRISCSMLQEIELCKKLKIKIVPKVATIRALLYKI